MRGHTDHQTYCFGDFCGGILDAAQLHKLFFDGQRKTSAFAEASIFTVAHVLDELAQTWQRGSPNWEAAFELMKSELSFSAEMIATSLDVIPELLSYRNVMARLKADFVHPERLDRFIESRAFEGRDRAFPLGVLFHVSAGNVFLGAIDSLLMGFLTKNISIVKLSSRNLAFPTLFAKSLVAVDHNRVLADKFSLVHFPGGSPELERVVKDSANAIIAWGGEEMIQSYKRDLPMAVKFIEYGPKISFQVITKKGLQATGTSLAGQAAARDIAMWDQAACASPQNLFVQIGAPVGEVMQAIAASLEEFPYPRGRLSDDECVEILKEQARAGFNKITGCGDFVAGSEYLLHWEKSAGLRTSPLNRTLIIKTYADLDDLILQLVPFRKHLQSCSLLASDQEEEAYLNQLGTAGVMRFAHLGCVMQAPIGAPHDGKLALAELTRIIPQERDVTVEGLINDAIANVPFYHKLREGRPVKTITEMPIISGSDLDSSNDAKVKFFSHRSAAGGYLFSSGGTSGSPKFALYSHDEFSKVADLLARGFAAQGIGDGSVVVNFFVAGNMWSSFLAVDRALSKLGARTLPVGGSTERRSVLRYLKQFQPEFLIGLPTQILELARSAEESAAQINIPSILYAGEHLSIIARSYISDVFKTKHFGSAGYASVDAGPVGYQCMHTEGGLHHLFSEHVHLEVVDGEAVVTSLVKRQMPVIRLRTGDLVECLPPETKCLCGSRDKLFRLLGRANSQFHVWGCRLFLQEFEYALADFACEGALFQIVISQDSKANELVTVRIEHKAADGLELKTFNDHLYRLSKDLRATHPRSWLETHLRLEPLPEGGIERVARTGKIKALVDSR